MKNEVNTNAAYSICINNLKKIAEHPAKVKEAAIGYFLSIENIQCYVSLSPREWFLHAEEKFSDLPQKDQEAILCVLQQSNEVDDEKDVVSFCKQCESLGESLQIRATDRKGIGALVE